MFDSDALIQTALTDPEQTWELLDSFWRQETQQDTRDLVHYQAWATLLCELNVHARAQHFLKAQTVPVNDTGTWQESTLNIPWFPIVLYRDRLVNQSFVLYGGGFLYDTPPEILYGEESGVPRFLLPLQRPWRSISNFCDAVTTTKVVIDQSQFEFNPLTGEVVFSVDPFTLITAKTDTDGREYIVLWTRNPEIDLNVPFDWTGWVVKYDRVSLDRYAESLKYIWELVLLGPSLGRYKEGMMTSMGFPFAARNGQIEWVTNDGYQLLISDGQEVYKAIDADVNATVVGGDLVQVGDPLTDGVTFMEYPQVMSATFDDIPGLAIDVPLSTGVVAKLIFANTAVEWTYEAGRPSEFRFPVGGAPSEIEQFWVDVDTFATANGIDFQTIFSLSIPVSPGPTGDAVNPMQRIIEDLLHNSVFVVSVELADMPFNPGGFHDRARQLLPYDVLIVLQQHVGDVSDAYDLGANTSETVTAGYNIDAPIETISVSGSGTDLTYFDYVPLVVTS